jgi:hypothetical protein
MTVASASTEARVSYQLFQSSSMRWPYRARPPAIKYTLSKGRAFAHKNAMLRFVACVLIARQHDLYRTGIGAALLSDARISSEGRLSPRSESAGPRT